MMRQFNRVAVLGAGVMGATIAGQLANAGLDVELLDMVPTELTGAERAAGLSLEDESVRNRIARAGLDGLKTIKPAPLYLPDYARQIRAGNFDDHLERLRSCDWVIEVIVEHLPIKLKLLRKISPCLHPEAILSTNTSGLSVNAMAEELSPGLRQRFLVTHFFNPPRYMHLLEIVPCRETDPVVQQQIAEFISRRLGKGVVVAKDTPNFIANRIGVYAIVKGIEQMMAMNLSVEEVDAVAGPATARPKSALFRTADLVGNDTLVHVTENSYRLLSEDEERDVFKVPAFLREMIEQGLLGNKSGSGFYQKGRDKEGKRLILAYDWRTGTYAPARRPKYKSTEAAKKIDAPTERIQTMMAGNDPGAEYAWRSLRDTLIYAVNRIPEVADDVVSVDNAMKWGFNWELGPFEMLDAIGVPAFIERVQNDGLQVPEALQGVESFYRFNARGHREFFCLRESCWRPVPRPVETIELDVLRRSGGVVEQGQGCSIHDLGEGVFGLEFHSKMNSIDDEILTMTQRAVERAEVEGVGLVVANQGDNFSVGANLMLLAEVMAKTFNFSFGANLMLLFKSITSKSYKDIEPVVRLFQDATMSLKYAQVPTVVAPFGMTLGGAAEYTLHADAVVAHAETYMGLVEVGVGLLPAGGGTKEMCLRAVELSRQYDTDVSPFIFKHFRQIGMASVATGAMELYGMNYLRQGDSVTMNRERLIGDARQKVLALAANYRPGKPAQDVPAPGRSIAASLKSQLWNMERGGFITEYERHLGSTVADVICGGDVPAGTLISEEYLLELERESFLSLCGEKKTAQRIEHMLRKGKPLRN